MSTAVLLFVSKTSDHGNGPCLIHELPQACDTSLVFGIFAFGAIPGRAAVRIAFPHFRCDEV